MAVMQCDQQCVRLGEMMELVIGRGKAIELMKSSRKLETYGSCSVALVGLQCFHQDWCFRGTFAILIPVT